MTRITILFLFLISFISCSHQHLVTPDEQEISTFLDRWHHAAATADEVTFFNSFTKDGIYIGTDATEHWKATELKAWAKSAFEKDVAWAFTPYNRHIYYAADGNTIWFDELLKTWMGPCRGSGVLQKENGQWKIAHYHLAIAVPNESIEAYLKLLPQDQIKK